MRGAGTAGETGGITEVELGPALWQRTCSFPFDGRRWDQDEWYFLARGWRLAQDRVEINDDGLTDPNDRSVEGARWWTYQGTGRSA